MRNYPFARGRVRIKKAEPTKSVEKAAEEVREEVSHIASDFLPVIKEEAVLPVNEKAMEITADKAATETVTEEQPTSKKKKKKNFSQK